MILRQLFEIFTQSEPQGHNRLFKSSRELKNMNDLFWFWSKIWVRKHSLTIALSDMATYFITGRKTTSSFHIKVRGTVRGRGKVFVFSCLESWNDDSMAIAMAIKWWPKNNDFDDYLDFVDCNEWAGWRTTSWGECSTCIHLQVLNDDHDHDHAECDNHDDDHD